MLQLTQNLKDGEMQFLEVPNPTPQKGMLLVKNHYSLISAGTESKTVADARKGYISKALARKNEVKKVMDLVKTQGVIKTYENIKTRLETPTGLGYSCAGEVIGVGSGVRGFKNGDFVACGGSGAVHAEVVSVNEKLCVKLPRTTDLKLAAFTTVAAIAIQGIRQADLQLAETCAVIGLGLIGQLTSMMLDASGIRTIGIDIDPRQLEFSERLNFISLVNIKNESLENIILENTHGYGCDAVIITASTASSEPVNLAGKICRKKGKVIIVGAVPTGFERADFYKKELELKMSSSYGPGRYDPLYEEKGVDYPLGYVRWTENRNMEAYIDLLQNGKLKPDLIITHIFDFKDAVNAYNTILDKKEHYSGILLKYDIDQKHEIKSIATKNSIAGTSGKPNVGFIGAGNFARNILLPELKNKVNFITVATAHGNTSKNIADKYNFRRASASPQNVLDDTEIDTVFIATRHNLHAKFVVEAAEHGKHVFCEKPLCLNEEELNRIKEIYETNNINLMVGYNRRFSPVIKKLIDQMEYGVPVSLNYRINAGAMANDHWIHDPETGGGRIIGELCHFIDLCNCITKSSVLSISATAMEDAGNLLDTLTVNMLYCNGSVASISYFSNGSKMLGKEYLEAFNAGNVYIVDDFRKLIRFGKRKEVLYSGPSDKGHKSEIDAYISSLSSGQICIPFSELYHTSLLSFKIREAVITRKTINISG